MDSHPQTRHPQGGGATADAGGDTRRRFGLSGFRTGHFPVFIPLAGINFKDIATLRYCDMDEERIYYARHKTSKEMTCHLSEQSKAIIGKYAKSDHADEDYIFPILDRRIHKTEQQIYDRVRKVLKHVNKALHEWSRLLGLKIELTTYVARHTFATVLKRSGVNIAIISESLGHSDLS